MRRVHHFDPEAKKAEYAMEAPHHKKVSSAGKVMNSIFLDSQCVFMVDYLEEGPTINGTYNTNRRTKAATSGDCEDKK